MKRAVGTGVVMGLLVCGGAGGVALAQGIWSGAGFERAPEMDEGDPVSGQFVAMGGAYGEQRTDCVRCHGLDGAGDESGAFPGLAGQGGWYLYKTLHDYAAGRRANDIMSPIASALSDQDMRDLAAYYSSLPRDWAWDRSATDTQTLQTGGAIAATGLPDQGVPACTNCHGGAGEGQFPVTPALAGQSAPYLSLQLELWQEGERDGDPVDVMERIASAMTDEQITAVAQYYAAMEAEPGSAQQDIVIEPPAPPAGPDEPFAPDVLPPYLEEGDVDADLSARGAARRQEAEGATVDP